MLNKIIGIDRQRWFYLHLDEEMTVDRVKQYKIELEKLQTEIKNTWEIQRFFSVNDDLVKEFIGMVKQEIEYCDFFLSTTDRIENGELFQWRYVTKDSFPDDWRKPEGDFWEYSNGKAKAQVQIVRQLKTTKIQLTVKNDASLTFISNYDRTKPKYKNLKSEESVKKQIELYMREAEETLSKINYPPYCEEKRNFDVLNKLLHN